MNLYGVNNHDKTTLKVYHLDCDENPEGGYMASFENTNWGPIVNAETAAEAKENFKRAFIVSLIAQAILNINSLLQENRFGEKDVKEVVEKNLKDIKNLQTC